MQSFFISQWKDDLMRTVSKRGEARELRREGGNKLRTYALFKNDLTFHILYILMTSVSVVCCLHFELVSHHYELKHVDMNHNFTR